VLNTWSAVNKAAQIHDVIDTHNLDVLVLTETFIKADAPDAVKKDVAPVGYNIVHAHRTTLTKGGRKKRGGGLAVIYRDGLKVSVLPTTSRLSTFEAVQVGITAGNKRVNLAGIYRPPPTATASFFEEFADFCDVLESLPGSLIIVGDFN
jgi:exonuclease III